jgi:hypothetical protein
MSFGSQGPGALLLDAIIEFIAGSLVDAEAVSRQVVGKNDFPFVVTASVTAGALVACVRAAGGDLAEDARVFDVYEGAQVKAGHKSMAVNVRMRAEAQTTSDDGVLGVRQAINEVKTDQLGAVLQPGFLPAVSVGCDNPKLGIASGQLKLLTTSVDKPFGAEARGGDCDDGKWFDLGLPRNRVAARTH